MYSEDDIKRNFGKNASEYRLSKTHSNSSDLERMIDLIKPDFGDSALDVATGDCCLKICNSPLYKYRKSALRDV